MRVLVADDDETSRLMLRDSLTRWGFEPVTVAAGEEALTELSGPEAPRLALLDWVMPGMDGVEVCRRVRARPAGFQPYLILLTARSGTSAVVAGLEAGADDFVVKPFAPAELEARLRVGRRVVELQRALADRVAELEEALTQVRRLRVLLPICSYCKKVRDDHNYWHDVEAYLREHTEARFTHGICPECWARVVAPQLAAAPPDSA